MSDLAALAEMLAAELRRSSGPGLAKTGPSDDELRWLGQAHSELLQLVGRLKRLGWEQVEIAHRMHVSESHLSKMISDGYSRGTQPTGKHLCALREIVLQATCEAVNCG